MSEENADISKRSLQKRSVFEKSNDSSTKSLRWCIACLYKIISIFLKNFYEILFRKINCRTMYFDWDNGSDRLVSRHYGIDEHFTAMDPYESGNGYLFYFHRNHIGLAFLKRREGQ